MDKKARQKRADKVNQLVMAIGCSGRKFFHADGKFSRFELDDKGRIWYIDKWTEKRKYTHYFNWIATHKITEGGTLKALLKSLQKYIMDGVRIPSYHLGEWPKTMCDGDVWGYGKDMDLVRTKAKALGIWRNEIGFYIRTDSYGFLSNFHRAEQTVSGLTYPTNEHYYQSMKAETIGIRNWISAAPKAYHAMMAGRLLRKNEIVPNWGDNKVAIMLSGLRAKFEQNDELAQKLIETGDAELFEDSPTDMFWGGQLEGSENWLGRCLMKIRDEFTFGTKNDVNIATCSQCGKRIEFGSVPIEECPHCGAKTEGWVN